MNRKKLQLWKSFIVLSIAFVMAGFTAKAESEHCRSLIGSGNSRAFLSVETNSEGQIIFKLYPFDEAAETGSNFTTFRGSGWNDSRIQKFTVNGDANANWKYFTRSIDIAASQVILTPVPGMIEEGDVIAGNETMEWRTPLDGNAYGGVSISYTYGSTCPQPTVLADPIDLAIDATGHLTFTGDENAPSHIAVVFSGSVAVYEQPDFTSGDVLNYVVPGDYTIKVRSIGDNNLYLNSGYSNAISWVVDGEISVIGDSEFCHKYWLPTGGGSAETDAVFITWETLEDGSMMVTLDGVGGNKPAFRSEGLRASDLLFGPLEMAGSNLVDISASANIATITPKSGVVIPEGMTVRYNGQILYLTAGGPAPHSNLYPNADLTYTYSTNCAGVEMIELSAPENVAVSEDGILTFDAVEDADTYNAFVYLGETEIYSQIPIESGDVLNFTLPGKFNVKVVAVPDVTSSEYIESDLSAAYEWDVNYVIPATVPVSEYCNWEIDPSSGGNSVSTDEDAAYWTWTTDAEGQIVISIEGKVTPETTAFRANGMDMSGFKVEGIAATLLLEKVGDNAGLTQTIRAKEGFELLPGLEITYSGKVEYRVLPLGTDGTALDDLYPTLTFPNPYIYGSNCSGEAVILSIPENLAITEDNELSFDAVNNAVSYKVYVYDEQGAVVHTQGLFASGDAITYPVPGHYSVKVQAIGDAAAYQNSGLSASVNWDLIAPLLKPENLFVDTENKLFFDEVTNATSYTVFVYQNTDDVDALVTLPDFEIGSVVEMGTNPYGTYYLEVIAIGDGDVLLDSPSSDTYTWDFQEPYVCNLLLDHPLIKGSEEITFVKPDNSVANTAAYFAPNWVPSSNYTFDISDNVVNIYLGASTGGNWQAQFRLIPETPIFLVAGSSYQLKATVKTSKSISIMAKIFDADDNAFFDLIPRQTLNSPEGTTFEIRSIIPPANLTKIFQILFDFGPNPADVDIEIYDIVICGEEGEDPGTGVGIGKVAAQGIGVYPNPVKDLLYISGIDGTQSVRVLDLLGKVVLEQQSNGTVNVSSLNKGIYLLSIDNKMVKFVKE